MDAQLKKGLIEIFILRIIATKEVYGYILVDELNRFFPDVSESAYYAILRRLLKQDYLEAYYLEESKGPKRKYYRLTPAGDSYLDEKIRDLAHVLDSLRSLGIDL